MPADVRLLPADVLFLFLQALKQAGYWKILTVVVERGIRGKYNE